MENHIHRLVIACLLGLGLANLGIGQEVSPAASSKLRVVQIEKRAPLTTPEEKVVRAAYEKLTIFNKAALLVDGPGVPRPEDDTLFLKFELRNFKAGPIQEILTALHSEIKTGKSGDIIDLTRVSTRLNKGEEFVAYRAEWTKGQYASIYDPHWTVGDLLGHSPDKYSDVGEYALYDVTVSFQGKSRSYRALALFHNAFGSGGNLKPSFWDTVVGSGGSLTDVWNEKRRPVGSGVQSSSKKRTPSFKPEGYSTGLGAAGLLEARWAPKAAFTSDSHYGTSSLSDPVENITEDTTGHTKGKHGEQVKFQGSCAAQSSNQQLCRVNFYFRYTYENGTTSNWFYVHTNRVAESIETATGPRGVPIVCHTGRGVATQNCLNPECNFTFGLTGSGANMQMTGGDVWRGQLVHRHTCNIAASGGSTVCMESLSPIEKTSSRDTPMNANPSCCSTEDRFQCIDGGGQWYDASCSCYSPIVIDVAGNGFNLTNAADGVLFDLVRSGIPDQISWTSAGSDDAWLALDRNGNGTIDDGKELFGSATPQPYLSPGESKNGFRALAMFDSAEYGGNDDGQIDSKDSVFSNLKLWQDGNHNGFSEAGELQGLTESDISVIELSYRDSRQKDENGNWFRYRAKIRDARGARIGRWAWDVFVQKLN